MWPSGGHRHENISVDHFLILRREVVAAKCDEDVDFHSNLSTYLPPSSDYRVCVWCGDVKCHFTKCVCRCAFDV